MISRYQKEKTEREKFLIELLDDLTAFQRDFDCLNDKEKFCLEVVKNAVFFTYVKEPTTYKKEEL